MWLVINSNKCFKALIRPRLALDAYKSALKSYRFCKNAVIYPVRPNAVNSVFFAFRRWYGGVEHVLLCQKGHVIIIVHVQ